MDFPGLIYPCCAQLPGVSDSTVSKVAVGMPVGISVGTVADVLVAVGIGVGVSLETGVDVLVGAVVEVEVLVLESVDVGVGVEVGRSLETTICT